MIRLRVRNPEIVLPVVIVRKEFVILHFGSGLSGQGWCRLLSYLVSSIAEENKYISILSHSALKFG